MIISLFLTTLLDYSQATDLESNESKPLLGKFQEGLVDRFAEAKSKKGFLPGENENIQVQLYDNRNESMKLTLIKPLTHLLSRCC